jgi:hypothetical protein
MRLSLRFVATDPGRPGFTAGNSDPGWLEPGSPGGWRTVPPHDRSSTGATGTCRRRRPPLPGRRRTPKNRRHYRQHAARPILPFFFSRAEYPLAGSLPGQCSGILVPHSCFSVARCLRSTARGGTPWSLPSQAPDTDCTHRKSSAWAWPSWASQRFGLRGGRNRRPSSDRPLVKASSLRPTCPKFGGGAHRGRPFSFRPPRSLACAAGTWKLRPSRLRWPRRQRRRSNRTPATGTASGIWCWTAGWARVAARRGETGRLARLILWDRFARWATRPLYAWRRFRARRRPEDHQADIAGLDKWLASWRTCSQLYEMEPVFGLDGRDYLIGPNVTGSSLLAELRRTHRPGARDRRPGTRRPCTGGRSGVAAVASKEASSGDGTVVCPSA